MANRHLLGAAAIALVAGSSANSAQAADVMPVISPVVTPAVVPPSGPVIAIRVDNSLHAVWFGGPVDVHVDTDIDLRVTMPSGFGFELFTGGSTYFAPPEFFGGMTARVFHQGGALEVGVYAGFGFAIPGGLGGYGFGGDFRLDTDRLTVESFMQANFFAGGFDALSTETDVTIHATDKLDIYFGGELDTDFVGLDYAVWAGAQLDLGAFKPYAGIWYGPMSGLGAEIGFDLEKQLGNGPFSLIGGGEVNLGIGGLVSAEATIGIRFQRGEFPD